MSLDAFFAIGVTTTLGSHKFEAEAIKAFARKYDPQVFHLDEEAARKSVLGGLCASGWHTAAISMGLMVRGEMGLDGGVIGNGVDNLRWPRPVRPGDRLRVVMEIAELDPEPSRTGRGRVRLLCRTYNQEDQVVQEMTARLLVVRRAP